MLSNTSICKLILIKTSTIIARKVGFKTTIFTSEEVILSQFPPD